MAKTFDKSLKTVAKPPLEQYGYLHDGKRRFIKDDKKGPPLIIEYQTGARYAKGTFTVNLIANGKLARLSMVKPTRRAKLLNRLFGDDNPWWTGLLLPKDQWWNISHSQKTMDTTIRKTVHDLESYGLSWLEQHKVPSSPTPSKG